MFCLVESQYVPFPAYPNIASFYSQPMVAGQTLMPGSAVGYPQLATCYNLPPASVYYQQAVTSYPQTAATGYYPSILANFGRTGRQCIDNNCIIM